MDVSNTNAAAGIIAAVIGAISMYTVMRGAKKYDARGAADAALWNAAPEMLKSQERRIAKLTEDYDKVWEALHKMGQEHEKCLRELGVTQRRLDRLEGGGSALP